MVSAVVATHPGTAAIRRVTPDGGIHKAIAAANPGDAIVLAPGVYYEKIVISRSGTQEAPIVLRAEEPGTATISGCPTPDFKLVFEKTDGGLYRACVPWRVAGTMADGRNLYRYNALTQLKSSTLLPEGFAWENNVLYLKLYGNQDARKANIEVSRATTGADAVNIAVEGSHIIVAGLRLHMSTGAAVRVTGEHVTIRDCFIDGAGTGVAGVSRPSRLVVEHCEFSGFPNYQWHRERFDRWQPLYSSNLSVAFIGGGGKGWKIRHNFVYECFDSLQIIAPGSRDPADLQDYSYNLIMNSGDDAVEFDSRVFLNLRFHHNVILDSHILLGISPVRDGGLMIDHNIGYISPDYGMCYCPVFKFGRPNSRAWRSEITSKGVSIVHNTFVNRRGVPFWCGRGQGFRYENMILENNIIEATSSYPWDLRGFEFSPHNLYHVFVGAAADWKGDLPGVIVAADAIGFVSDTKAYRHDGTMATGQTPAFTGMDVKTGAKKKIKSEVQMNFYLGDSRAVDAGVANPNDHHQASGTPDLGAIEKGSKWEFPRPGPRWATFRNIPYRPPFSPSLDLEFVGFD